MNDYTQTNTGTWDDGDVIFAWTRANAVNAGDQHLLTGDDAKTAREAGYKYPVYITDTVKGMIDRAVAHPNWCNDHDGVLWDILYMSVATGSYLNDATKKFTVIITGLGRKRYHTLIAQCGATDIDNPAPCITIMTPEEL